MRRTGPRLRPTFVALAIALLGPMPALGGSGLAARAPDNVDITGHWSLDASRSDDPAQARLLLQRSLQRIRPDRRTAPRDGPPPPAQPPGGAGNGPGPGPASGTNAPLPAGEWPGGAYVASPLTEFMGALANPDLLELRAAEDGFELQRADDSVSCSPGDVVAVMDRHGSSERLCGWKGAALVVVQTVKRGPRREDRYELTTEGTLSWTTTLVEKKAPLLVQHRSYRRDATATGATPGPVPRAVPAN